MADLHDMRARIRDSGAEPEPGGNGLSFWIITVCAIAVGFTVVMFAPRLYTVQRTAALPAFKDVAARPAGQTVQGPDVAVLAADPSRYTGKSADEIGKIADLVCAPRRIDGPAGIAVQSEQLHCLLTEAPARYCSAIQRSKITAAIINHFRVVEHRTAVSTTEVEPRVIAAIEDLIRAGYLLKPQRDDIGTVAPRPIKEGFVHIVGNKLPCPDPPWWAIWK